ncbi:glycine/sarcosine/betaine reductase component B subunit [Tissierella sp.]|uniref:glycine/sarcosine/betaine reductase component B subunit n=1 Tax=Tissierella sp. TaxID=41274 RepID=UPI0028677258|nr:glycine/sarcosine/betaine reductase component B subunit [Tissierella sp.]MDR7856989.1 glycine/sarcosine/betaine reductase component B subunit [Tissierella sp.]
MELILRKIKVKDIIFGSDIKVDNGVLSIAPEEIRELLLSDERILEIDIDIARPGESIRIIPVKDVIEPRAKLNGDAFPGVDGEIEDIGRGITYALKDCAVITTGPIVGFQEGIIDMKGPLTEYTPFSKLNNLVLNIKKKPGVTPHEHEEAVRIAGVKVAHYIAKKVVGSDFDEEEILTWDNLGVKTSEYPELPKVAYVYQCVGQGLLHDTYFYGKDVKTIVPTLVNPLEIFDGALVSGNCVSAGSKTTTYHHQNNAIIKECFKRHGKEINFIGVVLSPMTTYLADKYRNAIITSRTVEMLGADGVIQSQEGFGNPTTDLMMICKRLENKGIKTVLISNEDAGVDGKSESLPDGTAEANAMISTGNSNATLLIPPMDKVLGDLDALEHITGGFVGSRQEDGSLIIEIHGILGSHNLQGYSYLSAVTI